MARQEMILTASTILIVKAVRGDGDAGRLRTPPPLRPG
jgi:hypothetical protein